LQSPTASFHQIRCLKQISWLLGEAAAASLVSAFILSRPDYSNAVLASLPKSTIAVIQRVRNAAARLVACLRPRDRVTSMICDLHWLTVNINTRHPFTFPSWFQQRSPLRTATDTTHVHIKKTSRHNDSCASEALLCNRRHPTIEEAQEAKCIVNDQINEKYNNRNWFSTEQCTHSSDCDQRQKNLTSYTQ